MRHFDRWPTFEDAELISLTFDRGNHMAVCDRGDWEQRTPPSLEATFHVTDAEGVRRPAHVSVAFRELYEVEIRALSYQNLIQGLGLRVERPARLDIPCLRVDWGGTVMDHEVSLLCSAIAVLSVTPSDA